MKHITTLLIYFTLQLFSVTQSAAQVATYDDVLSKKVKGEVGVYISKDNDTIRVGDTLILGPPFRNETYDFILQDAAIATYPLDNIASGSKVTVKKIAVGQKLVFIYTTKANGYVYALRIINFEGAKANGEIKLNFMSSDEALAELKKWKDKLDLELISREQYEQKKLHLSKYIK